MSSYRARDGGYASRKLWVTVFSMVLLSAVCLSAKFIPALDGVYSTLCGAVTALAAIYVGGNTASKFVISKHAATEPKDTPPQA